MSRRRAPGRSAVAREEASPAGPEPLGSLSRTSGTVRGARRLVRPLAFSSLGRQPVSFRLRNCRAGSRFGRLARRALPQPCTDTVTGAFLHADSAAGS